jgi:hypothetical protein
VIAETVGKYLNKLAELPDIGPIEDLKIAPTIENNIPTAATIDFLVNFGVLKLRAPTLIASKDGLKAKGPKVFEGQFGTGIPIPVTPFVICPKGLRVGVDEIGIIGDVTLGECTAAALLTLQGRIGTSLKRPLRFETEGELRLLTILDLGKSTGVLDLGNFTLQQTMSIGGVLSDIFAFNGQMTLSGKEQTFKADGALALFKQKIADGLIRASLGSGEVLASGQLDVLGFLKGHTEFKTQKRMSRPRLNAGVSFHVLNFEIGGSDLRVSPASARLFFKVLFIKLGVTVPGVELLTPDYLGDLIKKLLSPDLKNLDKALLALLSGNFQINPFSSFGPGGDGMMGDGKGGGDDAGDRNGGDYDGLGDASGTPNQTDTPGNAEGDEKSDARQGQATSPLGASLLPPGEYAHFIESAGGGMLAIRRQAPGRAPDTIALAAQSMYGHDLFGGPNNNRFKSLGKSLLFSEDVYAHVLKQKLEKSVEPCDAGVDAIVYLHSGKTAETRRAGAVPLCKIRQGGLTYSALAEADPKQPIASVLSTFLLTAARFIDDPKLVQVGNELPMLLSDGVRLTSTSAEMLVARIRPSLTLIVAALDVADDDKSCGTAAAVAKRKPEEWRVRAFLSPQLDIGALTDRPDRVAFVEQMLRTGWGCTSPVAQADAKREVAVIDADLMQWNGATFEKAVDTPKGSTADKNGAVTTLIDAENAAQAQQSRARQKEEEARGIPSTPPVPAEIPASSRPATFVFSTGGDYKLCFRSAPEGNNRCQAWYSKTGCGEADISSARQLVFQPRDQASFNQCGPVGGVLASNARMSFAVSAKPDSVCGSELVIYSELATKGIKPPAGGFCVQPAKTFSDLPLASRAVLDRLVNISDERDMTVSRSRLQTTTESASSLLLSSEGHASILAASEGHVQVAEIILADWKDADPAKLDAAAGIVATERPTAIWRFSVDAEEFLLVEREAEQPEILLRWVEDTATWTKAGTINRIDPRRELDNPKRRQSLLTAWLKQSKSAVFANSGILFSVVDEDLLTLRRGFVARAENDEHTDRITYEKLTRPNVGADFDFEGLDREVLFEFCSAPLALSSLYNLNQTFENVKVARGSEPGTVVVSYGLSIPNSTYSSDAFAKLARAIKTRGVQSLADECHVGLAPSDIDLLQKHLKEVAAVGNWQFDEIPQPNTSTASVQAVAFEFEGFSRVLRLSLSGINKFVLASQLLQIGESAQHATQLAKVRYETTAKERSNGSVTVFLLSAAIKDEGRHDSAWYDELGVWKDEARRFESLIHDAKLPRELAALVLQDLAEELVTGAITVKEYGAESLLGSQEFAWRLRLQGDLEEESRLYFVHDGQPSRLKISAPLAPEFVGALLSHVTTQKLERLAVIPRSGQRLIVTYGNYLAALDRGGNAIRLQLPTELDSAIVQANGLQQLFDAFAAWADNQSHQVPAPDTPTDMLDGVVRLHKNIPRGAGGIAFRFTGSEPYQLFPIQGGNWYSLHAACRLRPGDLIRALSVLNTGAQFVPGDNPILFVRPGDPAGAEASARICPPAAEGPDPALLVQRTEAVAGAPDLHLATLMGDSKEEINLAVGDSEMREKIIEIAARRLAYQGSNFKGLKDFTRASGPDPINMLKLSFGDDDAVTLLRLQGVAGICEVNGSLYMVDINGVVRDALTTDDLSTVTEVMRKHYEANRPSDRSYEKCPPASERWDVFAWKEGDEVRGWVRVQTTLRRKVAQVTTRNQNDADPPTVVDEIPSYRRVGSTHKITYNGPSTPKFGRLLRGLDPILDQVATYNLVVLADEARAPPTLWLEAKCQVELPPCDGVSRLLLASTDSELVVLGLVEPLDGTVVPFQNNGAELARLRIDVTSHRTEVGGTRQLRGRVLFGNEGGYAVLFTDERQVVPLKVGHALGVLPILHAQLESEAIRTILGRGEEFEAGSNDNDLLLLKFSKVHDGAAGMLMSTGVDSRAADIEHGEAAGVPQLAVKAAAALISAVDEERLDDRDRYVRFNVIGTEVFVLTAKSAPTAGFLSKPQRFRNYSDPFRRWHDVGGEIQIKSYDGVLQRISEVQGIARGGPIGLADAVAISLDEEGDNYVVGGRKQIRIVGWRHQPDGRVQTVEGSEPEMDMLWEALGSRIREMSGMALRLETFVKGAGAVLSNDSERSITVAPESADVDPVTRRKDSVIEEIKKICLNQVISNECSKITPNDIAKAALQGIRDSNSGRRITYQNNQRAILWPDNAWCFWKKITDNVP